MASGESGEKKISFGFSKSIKKPVLNKNPQPEKKVDYIECLDEKSIKVVGGEEKKDEPLIIPMLGSKTWHDRILNKVNADIFEPKVEPVTNENAINVNIKQEIIDETNDNGVVPESDIPQPMEIVTVKEENQNEPLKTLEEQAASEILQDLKQEQENTKEISAVPLPTDDSLVGKQESTLNDYEQIPIEKFGEAMLRGMGWQPGKGIGKNQKIVAAVIPELRPRGMGLGADKITIQKQIAASKVAEEGNLKLVKGAFIKIITGKQSGNYGHIEGLDDDGGRLMIKLALGGSIISINESLVQLVTKAEFDKYSKVLNSKKYEEFKNKETNENSVAEDRVNSDSSTEENWKRGRDRYDKSRDRKKSKKHKTYSSDDDSESDKRSRRRKNSDDSDSDYKRKKSKKTKKHKTRDSSSERSNRGKRKHKERNRESRNSKKEEKYRNRRSRSRSPRRR
ncbi:G-patch domain and KOW motifs-containing protein [Leptopilina heterotoma]|uniref:G-patch domain and KOW motifs-containing protein n=1 Tax=Leptopilina heterotoma TaxID=63436 RepID=UPI001CA94A0E|nr:G-patch domain and KOW motifs-containing protein [Leptopilina heterotoma]XP_043470187.1 G-patch domain and KOW motifs-containing protein [Leptopilina heterotoma]XP_043470188.1 G-patch domain and KOW motifs-containing protein [Leptopilina heterotoma]